MALITDVGVLGTGILQPKLENRWRATFVGLGTSNTNAQSWTVQVTKFTRPDLTFERHPLDRYNTRVYILGKYTFSEANITFEDDTGGLVTQGVQDQLTLQENIINPNPAPMFPASPAGQLYKFAVLLQSLDGNETVYESWSLEGCAISKAQWSELTYSDSKPVTISLTLSVDQARQLVTGVEYLANGTFGALPP